MKATKLREIVLAFAEVISPVLLVQYTGEDAVYLLPEETLAVWMQLPDSSYSAMFLGWALAKGHDIKGFSPDELDHAVQTALVGENKNVMFDWLGDEDAKSKPH